MTLASRRFIVANALVGAVSTLGFGQPATFGGPVPTSLENATLAVD